MSERTTQSTADTILDVAEMLIQTRGYNAFSYNDIATKLGIRKPSVHYHFPTKAELGLAVVNRYIARIEGGLTALMADPDLSAMDVLAGYTGPFLEFADTPDRICLCGVLAGEILALPTELRATVEAFFVRHQMWLARILQRGLDGGDFHFTAPPDKMARTLFGALQGALLVKRATGQADGLRDVVSVLITQLRGDTPVSNGAG